MKILLIGPGIGVFAGIMEGLRGDGGGKVIVPAFVYLPGRGQKQGISQFSATGWVQWNIFWPIVIGATFARAWVKQLCNLTLARVFALMMIAFGISMLLKKILIVPCISLAFLA